MSEALIPTTASTPDFGANSWLVEEMYEQYRLDPASVGESWQEFFSDYKSMATAVAAVTSPKPEPLAAAAPSAAASNGAAKAVASPAVVASPVEDTSEPIRGASLAIVTNMERSLTVPTATSFRNVPAKLLEVNRSVINGY